ncbi:complement C1s subcomponent isoform X1 [Onychostruthus taczanowskii]|uniref:complement C1s subcomponent isoform X1 n=1 Tax=Onychostruthus taczanowskii TaxID=356909 RepID=UPI001B8084AE|nr:complement C1s subcomponent isoform X1 [Onychostruthus taczanowskii]
MEKRSLIFFCLPVWADAASMYGEILSPNYPQGYPNYANETWQIQVPLGYGIHLYFTHLDLEPSQDCEYDFVKVLSGGYVEGVLCGRKKPRAPGSRIVEEFRVPYNTLTMAFQSDFSNEERFTGFAAYYVAVDLDECTDFVDEPCSHYCNNYIGGYFCSCPPDYFLYEDNKTCGVNCSGNVFTESTGEIASPNYPSQYPENSRCDYRVALSPGYFVVLTIRRGDFDVEPADSYGICHDSLTIVSGKQHFGPYCGSKFPGPSEIKTRSNVLDIIFQTDQGIQHKGWKIRYYGDPVTCPMSVISNSVIDPKKDRYILKDVVKVTCVEGYEIVRQRDSITSFLSSCQENGGWSNSHLSCVPVNCGDPPPVDNAQVSYVSELHEPLYTAAVRYECEAPYYSLENKGHEIYRCSASGEWVNEELGTKLPKCVPVCGVPSNPIRDTGRIFGGTRAEKGNFPWQVYFSNPRASGVLISDRWVMTAAHVLEGYDKPPMYAGVINVRREFLTQDAEKLIPEASFIHPGWKEEPAETRIDFDNDIALLKLRDPVKLGPDISPICLPGKSPAYELEEGTLGYIAGWGRREKGKLPADLWKAQIPVVNMDKCRSVKPDGSDDSVFYIFTDNMICAGGGKDSCQGDSGGAYAIQDPLNATRYYVAGLISWGPKCGTFGLYTKVVRYLDWIRETMLKHEGKEAGQE